MRIPLPLYLLVSGMLAQSLGYAFFCPTNFNQIDMGNTMATVINQCGKPDKKETSTNQSGDASGASAPEEWTYYIAQTNPAATSLSSTAPPAGSLKTQFVFDSNDRLINMNVNGFGTGASNICGSPVQIGDLKEKVKTACGSPTFMNRQGNQTTEQPNTNMDTTSSEETTIFYYQSNPPAKLFFVNGQLIKKE